jgi:hypothetical protein
MSERIKACFDSPKPSDDLRRRVRTLPTRPKGHKPPMQLRLFTGVALAIIFSGFWLTRERPTAFPANMQKLPIALPTLRVGERSVHIYAQHWNSQGELCLIYTAGKKPGDAWIRDKDGVLVYQDTSVTTQDWEMAVVNPRGAAPSATVHLPMSTPIDLPEGTVPTARLAPDGCKYEAIAFHFAETARFPGQLYKVTISATTEDFHGEKLVEVVRRKWEEPRHGKWQEPSSSASMGLESQRDNPVIGERIPASWTKYGVNVAEAIRQLEELDRPR